MGWFSNLFSRWRKKRSISLRDLSELQIVQSPTRDSKRVLVPGILRNPSDRVKSRGLSYFSVSGGKNEWLPGQYNHTEVEILFDIESYAARATRAKLALFSKEGSEFIGKKDDRVQYIRNRLQQIERATGIPSKLLLRSCCRDLVVHSNAYWLKVRKASASGGKVRKKNNRTLQPVAGYFPLPPDSVIPEIDNSGNIVRWKQEIGGFERFYSVDDIVHFYTNKKAGYPLGVPSIWSCIDDIRALRNMEANVDALVHKHLFPIFLWKVGLPEAPAQEYPDGRTEIEVVEEKIATMPAEGSLVVSERFDVSAIGAENSALRVEPYLNHFRDRLLAGLDVSSIDVGVGNASSRSTAQTLSRNLIDIVKLQQITIEAFMDPVIEELLQESTFEEASILDPENMVHLRFYEIDREAKIAKENHVTDMFLKNLVTHPEAREEMGKDALLPGEEKELYYWKIGREEALINAVDESLSAGGNSVSNKNQPQNQHGERPSAKLNKDSLEERKDSSINPILKWHNSLRDELQKRWGEKTLKISKAKQDIRLTYSLAARDMEKIIRRIIREQYPDPERIHGLNKAAQQRLEEYIFKLRDEIIKRIEKGDKTPNSIFESLRYRSELIYDMERSWARNLSLYLFLKHNHVNSVIKANDNACDYCKSKLTIIKWNDILGETKLPPHHSRCICEIEAEEVEGTDEI